MNIDELERLAKAAKDHRTDFSFMKDFKEATTPAAVLELISINRELVAALELASDEISVCTDEEARWKNLAVNALARANGESNE